MFFFRILSVFISLLVAADFLMILWLGQRPYLIFLSGLSAVLLFSFWLIYSTKKLKTTAEYLFYLLNLALLFSGGVLTYILLENVWYKIGLILLLSLAFYFYYSNLFVKFYKTSPLLTAKFRFPYIFFEIFILFLTTTALFGFKEFLNYSTTILVSIMFILSFIINSSAEFLYTENLSKSKLYLRFISSLITAEIFWAIISLSVVYYLKSLIFIYIYMAFSLFISESYFDQARQKTIRIYMFFIAVGLVAMLLTAKWF